MVIPVRIYKIEYLVLFWQDEFIGLNTYLNKVKKTNTEFFRNHQYPINISAGLCMWSDNQQAAPKKMKNADAG